MGALVITSIEYMEKVLDFNENWTQALWDQSLYFNHSTQALNFW